MIHLAMDDLPAWRAAELRQFAYVHLAPSLDQMAATYQQRRPASSRPSRSSLWASPPPSTCPEPPKVSTSSGAGPHGARDDPRRRQGRDRGHRLGRGGRALRRARARPSSNPMRREPGPASWPAASSRPRSSRPTTQSRGRRPVTGSHHLSQHFLFRPMRGHADGSTPVPALLDQDAAVWARCGDRGGGRLAPRPSARRGLTTETKRKQSNRTCHHDHSTDGTSSRPPPRERRSRLHGSRPARRASRSW
jgi:hypothetical protein